MITIKIKREDKTIPLPSYATPGSAGLDLRSIEDTTINPGEWKAISTGLKIELPQNYEAQIRPRSGLALNYGITVLNTPGTIDADYRGEIKVILINHGKTPFHIKKGDRIAQLVITEIAKPIIIETETLQDTTRGTNGFGHTGIE